MIWHLRNYLSKKLEESKRDSWKAPDVLLSHLHWKSEVAWCLSFDFSGWLGSTPSFLLLYRSIPSVSGRDSVCSLAAICGIEFKRLFCFKVVSFFGLDNIQLTTHLSAPMAAKRCRGSSMIFIVAFLWWLSLAVCCCFQWTLLHGSWALSLAPWCSTVFAQLELHLGRIWQDGSGWQIPFGSFGLLNCWNTVGFHGWNTLKHIETEVIKHH